MGLCMTFDDTPSSARRRSWLRLDVGASSSAAAGTQPAALQTADQLSRPSRLAVSAAQPRRRAEAERDPGRGVRAPGQGVDDRGRSSSARSSITADRRRASPRRRTCSATTSARPKKLTRTAEALQLLPRARGGQRRASRC